MNITLTAATRIGLNLLILLGAIVALRLGESIFIPLVIALLLATILWSSANRLHEGGAIYRLEILSTKAGWIAGAHGLRVGGDDLLGQGRAALFFCSDEGHTRGAQCFDQFAILLLLEKLDDTVRDAWPHFIHLLQFFLVRVHQRIHRTEMLRQKLRRSLANESHA